MNHSLDSSAINRSTLTVGALLLVVFGIVIGYTKNTGTEHSRVLGATDLEILDACVDIHIPRLEVELSLYDAMQVAFSHCHSMSYTALDLEDYRIRKAKYSDQSKEEPILLWTVVAITISGVLLAAYQVFVSFRLADKLGKHETNVAGEITFDKDSGFIIKSSVTGLLILVVSFAFFLTYIKWVYRMETMLANGYDGRPEVTVFEQMNTLRGADQRVLNEDFVGGGLIE